MHKTLEILNETGAAQNVTNSSIPLSGSPEVFESATIDAPAAGYVLAIGSGEIYSLHTNGTVENAALGVSADCDGTPTLDDDQDNDFFIPSGLRGSLPAAGSVIRFCRPSAGRPCFAPAPWEALVVVPVVALFRGRSSPPSPIQRCEAMRSFLLILILLGLLVLGWVQPHPTPPAGAPALEAEQNRIVVEEAKPAKERGYYLHPALYGQPAERSVEWARDPEGMRAMQEMPHRL